MEKAVSGVLNSSHARNLTTAFLNVILQIAIDLALGEPNDDILPAEEVNFTVASEYQIN